MSSLQTTLIVLGIVVVLAVVAYNQWHHIRHAPRKARRPAKDAQPGAQQRKEPGLDASPAPQPGATDQREPSLGPTAPAAPAAHAPGTGLFGLGKGLGTAPAAASDALAAATPTAPPTTAAAPEPGGAAPVTPPTSPSAAAVDAAAPAAAPALPLPPGSPGLEFDSLVFSVVELALDKPISGDAALAAQPPTRRIGKKQFLIQGLNTQTRQWEAPHAGSRYSQFQAAIQLANRQGALNEIEFSEFVLKTQEFADAIGAAPDFPDMLHEVARGREIDHFAAQNDAVLNLMLLARRATWSPGYVQQCAARHGFKPSVTPGRLVLPAVAPHAPPVLVLSYDAQAAMADDLDHVPVQELLITLDLPNVDRTENAFERLRGILDELAETMEAHVTDADGRKLPAMAMDSIGSDIERLYDALEARGFPAGSPSAMQLFS
ncbi:cell division protein FtsZ [Vandammella animalimorsus]|uniref:Cell division protein FtsZ n=1 Tax=Vandammella animalimorsus TaxID=2029117 RepID=A0A2A2AKJ0_9BURK|nr:cell division protein FtsZ [Vandammella animalimorsus]PAT38244.1 cell division protein FtsZ [Vandammella animalimorsus]